MLRLRTVVPPELSNNVIRQHNEVLVVNMMRQQFKKHVHETEPEKIQKLKDVAAKGPINDIIYESEVRSAPRFTKSP